MITVTRDVGCTRAIEALRSGVPNREAVRLLGCSHPDLEKIYGGQLAGLGEGHRGPGMLVAGDFGSGKSHLLEYFQDVALRRGFVVSRVVVSKETPFHSLEKMFKAAVETATLPDKLGPALGNVAPTLRPDAPEFAALYLWASNSDSGLDERFPATLYLLVNSADESLQSRIVRYWSGEKITLPEIRNGLSQLGMSGAFTIRASASRTIFADRLRFCARLFQAAGYRGWVILIDELELIGRYSILQRARSYAQMDFWFGGGTQLAPLDGITVVGAITSDFDEAVLGDDRNPRDLTAAYDRLRWRGEEEAAEQAARGMRRIWADSHRLEPPTRDELVNLHAKLRDIHALAYGWDPPRLDLEQAAIATRMREYIRRWINEWDLRRLDASYTPETEFDHMTVDYTEDTALENDIAKDGHS